jgi:hypothetical protein
MAVTVTTSKLPLQPSLRREIGRKKVRKSPRKEKWIDDKDSLDRVLKKISLQDPSTPQNLKVMESMVHPMDCSQLFDCLFGQAQVKSVSLVGVRLTEHAANRLALTLRHPGTKIRVLQIWRFPPECLPVLCDALRVNKELREIRLTFRNDLNEQQTSMMLNALEENQGLRSIKLFGVDLSHHTEHLATLLRHHLTLKELRLSRCELVTLGSLAEAIGASQTLQKLDLSMNDISSDVELAAMIQSKSLKSMTLGKNLFGKEDGALVGQALGDNLSLEELLLESNPLSKDFAASLLCALEKNAHLKRLGFLKGSLPDELNEALRHLVSLNEAGRSWMREASTPNQPSSTIALLPQVLHRVQTDHSVVFDLLRNHSNLLVNEE